MQNLLYRKAWLSLLSVAALTLPACSRGDPGKLDVPGASGGSRATENRIVFKNAAGKELRAEDLQGLTGTFRWEVIGGEKVPVRAKELHDQGRRAGGDKEYDKALDLFEKAHALAPDWPYPVYDAAWTYVLKKDRDKALEYYERVDKMAPRGFFTAKTALDTLKREKAGDVVGGLYEVLVMLEGVKDEPARKRAMLEAMLKKSPKFPAAWKALAILLEDDKEKMAAIDKGLSHDPDGETKGILLINKALILDRRGDSEEAKRILGELALDAKSTLGTEYLAKATLANLLDIQHKRKRTP